MDPYAYRRIHMIKNKNKRWPQFTMKHGAIPAVIVLINGPRGAGKDTVAQMLVENELGRTTGKRLALADAVRYEYMLRNPEVSYEALTDRVGKERHRKGLIELSESRKAQCGQNYWARQLRIPQLICQRQYRTDSSPHIFVISDWRFLPEYKYFILHGSTVITVRVTASRETLQSRGIEYDPEIDEAHGERGLEGFPFDCLIENDGNDLSELQNKIHNAYVEILEKTTTTSTNHSSE